MFRHPKSSEFCHWRKSGDSDQFCCELNMADTLDRYFLDLAVLMFDTCPEKILNVDLLNLLNDMKHFHSQHRSMHTIETALYDNAVLDMGVNLARAMHWQDVDYYNWSGKRVVLVVDPLSDQLALERLETVSNFVSELQCAFHTTIFVACTAILNQVVFRGFGNVIINCFSKSSSFLNSATNLMTALHRLPEIVSNHVFPFERFFQYRESNGIPIELDDEVWRSLVAAAVYMNKNMLSARLEIKGLEMPVPALRTFLRDVVSYGPALHNPQIGQGHIVHQGVQQNNASPAASTYFQIISQHGCTIMTSYPHLKLHIGDITI